MSESSQTKRPRRVMLVEDDPSFRKMMSYMFQDWGLQVVSCRDGLEAIDVLRHLRPDLIISDLDMPFINGIELFKRCKDIVGEPGIPFFIISAIPDAEERLKDIRDELAGFYAKPVAVKELKRIVFRQINDGTT